VICLRCISLVVKTWEDFSLEKKWLGTMSVVPRHLKNPTRPIPSGAGSPTGSGGIKWTWWPQTSICLGLESQNVQTNPSSKQGSSKITGQGDNGRRTTESGRNYQSAGLSAFILLVDFCLSFTNTNLSPSSTAVNAGRIFSRDQHHNSSGISINHEWSELNNSFALTNRQTKPDPGWHS